MNTFFTQNRNNLSQHIADQEMVLLFAGSAPKSTADANYDFKQNKNFFYFTGLKQENFILAMTQKKGLFEATLFIEKPDFEVEKWYGRKLSKETATEISGIEKVEFLEAFEPWLNKHIYNDQITSVYLDLEKLSYNEAHSKTHEFAKSLRERYLFLTLKTIHPVCSSLRVIKDAFEIEQMQAAIDQTKMGLEAVMKTLQPGMAEYEMASIFSHTIQMLGADGNSFPTIAASGSEAVILHYVENDRVIEDDTLLLLDLGAQFRQYAADISRTYPANGKFNPRQKELYNIVLKVQEAVISSMKPGVPFEQLNNTCKTLMIEELKAIGLIQEDSEITKYYYHGVSHYLGLDVHDLGNRELCLAPGMVLTVEPGLYIAEENIGIRIEDDILITETGHEVLSADILKTVADIEGFMGR